MTTIKAYAAKSKGSELEMFEYNPGELQSSQVEIKVIACGICHSDLSMLNNDWGMTTYPFVPGHEIIGEVTHLGDQVTHLKKGQKVGVGWYTKCCLTCLPCRSGDHNLCQSPEQTIVGRHGGFADKLRCDAFWAIPLPDKIDPESAGPLFCGGATVFNPLVEFNVKPTDRVGVIGIGGLGHLAVQFLNKWGCHVTAFTSSKDKADLAKQLGAHRIINSRSGDELDSVAGEFDFILVTVNVDLDWDKYFAALSKKGHLHVVGAIPNPIPAQAFTLLASQKSIAGSPTASAATIQRMLDFCERHNIKPMTETFPMSKVNDALENLKQGKPRFRLVLKNDF